MARTNFEDSVYKDPNFPTLLLKVGDAYRTKGMLLTAWELAQVHWLKYRGIPVEKWPEDLNVLLETKFARTETRDSGVFIYVSGSKEHCKFLEGKSNGGKKGGKSKSPAKLRSLKQNTKPPKQNRNTAETEPKQNRNRIKLTETSVSNSFSSSSSGSNSTSFEDTNVSSTASAGDFENKASYFIAGYCSRFRSKHGSNPEIQGKDAGIATRVTKPWSREKVDLYLDAFFGMPDAVLFKKKHPLSDFEFKLNEIVVFANTGNFTTFKESQHADSIATNVELLKKVQGARQ